MTTYEKKHKIPKPADLKRIDPIDKTKKSRHKRKYPPHWEIRGHGIYGIVRTDNGFRYYISASKGLKGDTKWQWEKTDKYGHLCYQTSSEYKRIQEFLKENKLDEALAIYAEHHPETINWPVRFIHATPLETTREVIQ